LSLVRKAGRRLHNEELYALCSSPNIISVIKSRRLRWAAHITCMDEKRGACMVLVRKPERRSLLVRSRRGWEDNIKMDFWEVVWWHGLDLSYPG
jgi:hypothetical protein